MATIEELRADYVTLLAKSANYDHVEWIKARQRIDAAFTPLLDGFEAGQKMDAALNMANKDCWGRAEYTIAAAALAALPGKEEGK